MQPDRDQNMSERARRFDQLDRKLGILWSRFWSLVVGTAGIVWIGWFFTKSENSTPGSMAFAAIIGLVLLFVARVLWRSKDRMTDLIDDADKPVRRSGQAND